MLIPPPSRLAPLPTASGDGAKACPSRSARALLIPVTLALIAALVAQPSRGRTVYVDGAHVYLPRLRRILSFGGQLNSQPQDSIVSLDLTVAWKTAAPAMTVLSPSLTEPADNLIPHVSKSADGTYTIVLYGTTIGTPPNAQNNKVKHWRITTKDGKLVDSLTRVDVATSAWAPISPCKSTTATALSEMFPDAGQDALALSYVYGGYPRNATGFDAANATVVLAEMADRSSGDTIKALPSGSRPGPIGASACALSYISAKKLLVHGMRDGQDGGVSAPSVYDLVNMRWDQYKGAYPMTSRSKNQYVMYNKSPQGKSYVLSVGSYWRTDRGDTPYSSIWYSELDGEKPWVNATVYGDPGFLFRHGVVVVDHQLLVLGFTDDISAAQAATAVAVFAITEPSPGSLEFRWSDQFVPLPVNGDPQIVKPPTRTNGAIVAGAAAGGVALVALLAVVIYRRVRNPAAATNDKDKGDSSHNRVSTPNDEIPSGELGGIANDHMLLDQMLFGPGAGRGQQPPPPGVGMWASNPQPGGPLGTLPPAPPQPDSMVQEHVHAILNRPRHSLEDGRQDEPLIIAPAPVALTGHP